MNAAVSLFPPIRRGLVALRALRELGLRQVSAYAAYRFSVQLGWVARAVAQDMIQAANLAPESLACDLLVLPDKAKLRNTLDQEALQKLFIEADEICAGKVRLFGQPASPLQFSLPGKLRQWVKYEESARLEEIGDIKIVWEPGRFGWAIVLARAYYLSQDERYLNAFWRRTDDFFTANPAGYGPHWASAQEVALRLICLVFAWQVFAGPRSTPERTAYLARWVAMHAARIPPSLNYARAQNNNHLLSEAVGLYTAGLALPKHPQAARWQSIGRLWLNQGLKGQIASDGTYVQHSTNYHRLMLQVALWSYTLACHKGDNFAQETLQRLSAATNWLNALLDPQSGCVPNLGANDGANILPLSTCAFTDYRPVIQAAGLAFNATANCSPGPWDEMALWFGQALPNPGTGHTLDRQNYLEYPTIIRIPQDNSWAYLRTARFNSRPGHADQLHFDLWWRGLNLALDAGTYSYNDAPPWDNQLSAAFVHNTVTLDGLDQMERVGRFLYLRRAQAEITEKLVDQHWQRITARHDGYRRLNGLHVRSVERIAKRWVVRDQIVGSPGKINQVHYARIHWLLPDFPWNLDIDQDIVRLRLDTPYGTVSLFVATIGNPGQKMVPLLVSAGKRLAGQGDIHPTWGWFSPTYTMKHPALSLSVTIHGKLPFEFTSTWELPDG